MSTKPIRTLDELRTQFWLGPLTPEAINIGFSIAFNLGVMSKTGKKAGQRRRRPRDAVRA